jgi:hypothetical protein
MFTDEFYSNRLFMDKVNTPAPLIKLTYGYPMYTTPDFTSEIHDYYMGQLEIADIMNKQKDVEPLTSLYKIPVNQINILSARYIENGVSVGSANGSTMNLNAGRKTLSNSDFIKLALKESSDIIISMADEIPFTSSSKRHSKALERTNKWLDELLKVVNISSKKCFIFGVVLGGRDLVKISKLAQDIMQKGVNGLNFIILIFRIYLKLYAN